MLPEAERLQLAGPAQLAVALRAGQLAARLQYALRPSSAEMLRRFVPLGLNASPLDNDVKQNIKTHQNTDVFGNSGSKYAL